MAPSIERVVASRKHFLIIFCRFAALTLLAFGLAGTGFAQPSQLDPTATQLTAGSSHNCALTSGGGVQCWGGNFFGQLGNGTIADSATPMAVSGLASDVVAITAGDYHTCALTSGGGVQCWGYNNNGQLGNGSTTNSPTPVSVSGLASGVIAIAGGGFHTCALTRGDGVQCWGGNLFGELGNGTTTESPTPVAVSGLASGVVAITIGFNHTCAVTSGGGVQCWGRNRFGQLGNYSRIESPTPVAVNGFASGVVAITADGNHTCALTSGGGVQCWGYNLFGQLGNGSTTDSPTPVTVSGLASGVVAITAGAFHTCALTSGGAVQCWGNNPYGGLGNGTITDSATPVAVSGLASGVVAVVAGGNHTCALISGGGVQCWGLNSGGELGNGSTTSSVTPVAVSGLASGVFAITATALPDTGGSLSCTPNPVLAGSKSTCTATANAGFSFANFSGDCTGSNPCTLTNVNANKSVTANFVAMTTFSGTTATGSGASTAAFTGGGATCRFDPAATGLVSASVAAPVADSWFMHGWFKFKLIGCIPGATVRMSITWPYLNGADYLKYGSTDTSRPASVFYTPAQIAIDGSTVSFDVTDGGSGDDDGAVNGEIVDPSGPLQLPPHTVPIDSSGAAPHTVPVDSPWTLLLLALAIVLLARKCVVRGPIGARHV